MTRSAAFLLMLTAAAGAMFVGAHGEAATTPGMANLCGVSVALPADTRIVSATRVAAGDAVAGTRDYRPARAFCRVQGVIEQEIGFELWLPEADAWNRRFLGAGVGGQAGSIATGELARAVERGYAAASTDTGHKASDPNWLVGRPDRAVNYAERANHLLAVNAKAIVAAFFGNPARQSIFVGCSGGGRQAMTQMQRFPDDYDGILAGAPGVNTPEMSARRLWEMIQHSEHEGVLDEAGWRRIASAATATCDPQDGLADGIVEDPRQCTFRPGQLACKPGEAAVTCLTGEQVALAERIYAPLRDEQGRQIDPGILPGTVISPVPAPEPFTPGPKYLATVLFGQGIYNDPEWDVRKFIIARDLPAIDRVMNLHADDPAIDPFVRRGGKLILYHGLADPLVAAVPTIEYYDRLKARFGAETTSDFARLFLIPGMDHCRGGGVPDRFGQAGGLEVEGLSRAPGDDLLSALEQWLDGGPAPDNVRTALVRDGNVVRTRLACAYPQRARHTGGAADRAESYVCEAGAPS